VLTFLLHRVAAMIAMLLLITFATFGMYFAGPSDPAAYSCARQCTPQIIETNRHALGFDKPIRTQYLEFVEGLFRDRSFPDDPVQERKAPETIAHCHAPCLGYSMVRQESVTSMIGDALPVTASLVVGGFLLWMLVGVSAGCLAAIRRGRWLDRVVVGLSLITYSLPTFFIGLLLLTFVAIRWRLLPVPTYTPIQQDPIAWARGLLLPWATVAASMAAAYVRLTRAYMTDVMAQEFVRTARAKGVREWRVVVRHGLRAALTPIVTAAGLDLGALLGGMVVVEQVFSLNGLGRLAVQSVVNVDLPVIVGLVLVAAATYTVANLVVDILYGVIDPRVRVR
jgi:peptide/nickel transport system permease protein